MLRSARFPAAALVLAVALPPGPAVARAAETSLFGPSADLVSKDVPFRRLAQPTGEGPFAFVNPFSDTMPLSPGSTAYTGPVFHGGYVFTSSSIDVGITRQQIRNDRNLHGDTADTITLQAFRQGGWADSVLTLHGVYVFKLAPASAVAAAETLDGVSLAWSGSGNSEPGRAPFDLAARLVVRKDDAYHISDTRFSLVATRGSFALEGPALRAVRWAPYAPASRLAFSPPAAGFAPLDLGGVTAVGVYFENNGWLGSANANAAFTWELGRVSVSTRAPRAASALRRTLLPAPPPAG